ncbi:Clp protease ClpP [Shinella sp. H4-D48]|uniref:head maturation protease, ClpP-related n=1 Tax=Shinella sp. H4-D48 TaxID=2925841 RepID=UPI001F53768A|nr:head maturation protease, ClpP-related [Shinella sp. H4-D48]UNK36566.1 Clp protease ClpP [Shinella sp. H4-D48]
MTVQVKGQEVTLSGTVGVDWFDDGFTHAEVVTALAGLDGDITVRLNSGGGIAADGAAIHAALATYDGSVHIIVEGIAASAASLIAMAGDRITVADGAVMMIHDPLNVTYGNSADHAKTIEELEAYATAYAKLYARRSGKTAAECRDIMKAETWYDGDEAVAAGFADDTGEQKAKPVAAYDYRAYANAPKRFAAQAKAKGWSMAKINDAASSAAHHKDTDMSEKERADALAAELATMKAEKAAAEAKLAELDADKAKAVADALKADRERRAAIMSLDEAKGREALAEALFADGADAEKAKALLAVAPVAAESADDAAAAYEANRLAGATLNGGKQGGDAQPVWAKAVARANKLSKK